MGRLQKTNPKLVNPETEIMILHNQLQQQDLVKKNRILLMLVSVLMMVVFVLGSFLLPAHNMVEELKEKQLLETETADGFKNPALTAEIDSLKSQLVGLVSGSIENKLSTLEKSIKMGSVLGSLETVNSLKEDIKVLRTYSNPLEQKKQQDVVFNKVLAQEVSHLKNLMYLTLGSCGLMFAALAGIWIKGRKQLISRLPDYLEKKN